MTSMIRDYVRWTGDVDWLNRVIEGTDRPVIDYLADFALHWKTLPNIGGVADYGGINNLLECVGAYVHGVASLNAANVYKMRNAAELLDLVGRWNRLTSCEVKRQHCFLRSSPCTLTARDTGVLECLTVRRRSAPLLRLPDRPEHHRR